jgi:hypothetical protein
LKSRIRVLTRSGAKPGTAELEIEDRLIRPEADVETYVHAQDHVWRDSGVDNLV